MDSAIATSGTVSTCCPATAQAAGQIAAQAAIGVGESQAARNGRELGVRFSPAKERSLRLGPSRGPLFPAAGPEAHEGRSLLAGQACSMGDTHGSAART